MKLFALILLSINCALVASAATTVKASPATSKGTSPSVKPTAPPTPRPTTPPLDKSQLIAKGNELQKSATDLITKLTKANRQTLTTELKHLSDSIGQLVIDLQATDAKTGPVLLNYMETELFWFEERMKIEFAQLDAANTMVERLLTMSKGLSLKIEASMKDLEGTPMGDVMKQEGDSLDSLISDLANAKNPTAIEQAGKQLAKMTDRVEKELRAFIPPF